MNKPTRYYSVSLFVIGATLLLGGCATAPNNPISDTLTVQPVSTPGAQLWHAEANGNTDGKGITVTGELLPRGYLVAPPTGHVDIDVIAPGKEILQHSCVPYRVEHLSRKQRRYLFRAAVAIVPPKNSIIRVTPHAVSRCTPLEGL